MKSEAELRKALRKIKRRRVPDGRGEMSLANMAGWNVCVDAIEAILAKPKPAPEAPAGDKR